jgi:hypothetical protein
MKMSLLLCFISLVLGASVVVAQDSASSAPKALRMSASEQAVWQQEENYWRLLKADNRQAYLDLWDDRFVGWPLFDSTPIHKDKIIDFMSDIKVLDYKLEPLSVRKFRADIVITFYRANVRSASRSGGNESTRTSRLTHTWMKTEKGWHIIGGMSAVDQTSPLSPAVTPKP